MPKVNLVTVQFTIPVSPLRHPYNSPERERELDRLALFGNTELLLETLAQVPYTVTVTEQL